MGGCSVKQAHLIVRDKELLATPGLGQKQPGAPGEENPVTEYPLSVTVLPFSEKRH